MVVAKMKTMEKNRKVLSRSGMRATSQRALILDIIREGHLDADEVYRRARERHPRLSLSTVYRTLQKLKERGLIDELHFNETHHHYEIKQPTWHHHLVCLSCGKIIEFACPLSQKMKEDVARQHKFAVTGIEVNMTGYCSDCAKDSK